MSKSMTAPSTVTGMFCYLSILLNNQWFTLFCYLGILLNNQWFTLFSYLGKQPMVYPVLLSRYPPKQPVVYPVLLSQYPPKQPVVYPVLLSRYPPKQPVVYPVLLSRWTTNGLLISLSCLSITYLIHNWTVKTRFQLPTLPIKAYFRCEHRLLSQYISYTAYDTDYQPKASDQQTHPNAVLYKTVNLHIESKYKMRFVNCAWLCECVSPVGSVLTCGQDSP